MNLIIKEFDVIRLLYVIMLRIEIDIAHLIIKAVSPIV